MPTSLLCDKAYQITNTKTCAFSDSVLCVKNEDDPTATWKSKIKWYSENDGMPTEFEKIFPLDLLEKIQSLMTDLQWEPENFKDRIIFISKYHDIGKQKETKNNVNTIHRQLRMMLANSLAVIGLSRALDQKRNGTEP